MLQWTHEDPRQIGPYGVIGVLGEGGMGRVYLGQDREGNFVAIKRMSPDIKAGGKPSLARFEKELKAAKELSVEFTPAVRGHDLECSDPWIAVDYIKAPTLRQLLEGADETPLPVESVAWLGNSLCHALEALAAKQIIHRDIHPGNILVRAEGALLIDFGLARDTRRPITTPYRPFGTPGFAAPEQMDVAAVQTIAVDVYSFGACLAYAAAKAVPRVNVNWVVERNRSGDPKFTGERSVPAELRRLVYACMRADPLSRPTLEHISKTLNDLAGADSRTSRPHLPPRALGILREFAETPVQEQPEVRQPTLVLGASRTLALDQPLPMGRSDGYVRPAVAHGTLVAAGLGGVVCAFETDTLEPRWRHETKARVESAPAIDGNTIVVATSDHRLNALSATTGHVRWHADLRDTVASAPTISEGIVIHGDSGGQIAARTIGTGALLWTFETRHIVHAAPVAHSGRIFVGSWNRFMYAFDLGSGDMAWIYPSEGAIHASAAVARDTVYFGSGDQRLHAVAAEDGSPKWSFATGGAVNFRPVVRDRTVYFASTDGCLYAVDAESGKRIWRTLAGGAITSSPVLIGDRVYVGGVGQVNAVCATDGSDRSVYKIGDSPVVELADNPAADAPQMIMGAADGTLLVVDLDRFVPAST
ncbi:PQQ-binding-like beta-propeller repeat protein [Streptosporangiaceae bacterium NEAU-GS5]|nr:PQQ-binding-like beta-propeller repeat protein [Streptosporangiaceae bacterium NEAU-GS5]